MSLISHPLVARASNPVNWIADQVFLGKYRARLVETIEGDILDLGTGAGAMLPRICTAVGEGGDVHAIEPDPYMRAQATRRIADGELAVSLTAGVGEQLPYQDGVFDTIVSSMVFCTVHDPKAVASECARVIRPGGTLLVLEHVSATGWQGRFQEAVSPIWERVAGGCHPTRDTHTNIMTVGGLSPLSVEVIDTGIPPVRPFIIGRYKCLESQ